MRVKFEGLWIPSLVFADDAVLLASSNSDLQLTLGRFAVECEATGIRISTSKSETMVRNWRGIDCPLEKELLAQVEALL